MLSPCVDCIWVLSVKVLDAFSVFVLFCFSDRFGQLLLYVLLLLWLPVSELPLPSSASLFFFFFFAPSAYQSAFVMKSLITLPRALHSELFVSTWFQRFAFTAPLFFYGDVFFLLEQSGTLESVCLLHKRL